MEIKVEAENYQHSSEEKLPLLQDIIRLEIEQKTPIQKAISQTYLSASHLANLLPIGSILTFELLSPFVTNQGEWDLVSWSMTAGLIALCGVPCFISSFTDSFRDKNGNVRYGFATMCGLRSIDGSAAIPHEFAAKYRLRTIDVTHAFMSTLVFAVVVVFDQNVLDCFYPTLSDETIKLLEALPVGIGVICGVLFVVFPTRRHRICFPLSAY